MQASTYDFIIVGSGAGGATLASELAQSGASVAVIERGSPAEKMGSFRHMLPKFDINAVTKTPKKSKEGVILWRGVMDGGSTVVSCGNGTPCLGQELLHRRRPC